MYLPKFPGESGSVLKPSTEAQLFGKAIRRRVFAQHIDTEVSLYIPATHGIDVLIHLWSLAARHDETLRVFGQYAQSPTSFVKHVASATELLVLHEKSSTWTAGEGLLGFCGLDDTEAGGRARLHQYVAPAFRHPALTYQLGKQALEWIFVQTDFALLYGLTPCENRAAIRFALRMGFTRQGILPSAIWYDGRIVDAVQTILTRQTWANRG